MPVVIAGNVFRRGGKKNCRWIAALSAIPVVAVLLLLVQIKTLYGMVGSNAVLVSAGFYKVLAPTTYFQTYVTSVIKYYFPRFLIPIGLTIDPQFEPVEHWYSP